MASKELDPSLWICHPGDDLLFDAWSQTCIDAAEHAFLFNYSCGTPCVIGESFPSCTHVVLPEEYLCISRDLDSSSSEHGQLGSPELSVDVRAAGHLALQGSMSPGSSSALNPFGSVIRYITFFLLMSDGHFS